MCWPPAPTRHPMPTFAQAKLELLGLQSVRWAAGTPLPEAVWKALVKEVKCVMG